MIRCTNQQNRNDHFCSVCKRRIKHGESYWRDSNADLVCDLCEPHVCDEPHEGEHDPNTCPCPICTAIRATEHA